MHRKNVFTAGLPLGAASQVLILLHGRGSHAQDILSLSAYLRVDEFALLAPQAANHTWYPFSFLAPPAQNEPWLSSALTLIDDIVEEVITAGLLSEKIYFTGFSQGACLTLEYTARKARRWGGIVAFTGGLIGDKIYPENYCGYFAGTPIFIGSSDPDLHVPVERVGLTASLLSGMGAAVTRKLYPGMGHTIHEDEITQANKVLTGS